MHGIMLTDWIKKNEV